MPPFDIIAKPAQSLLGLSTIIHFHPIFALIPRHYARNYHSAARFRSSLPCSFSLLSLSLGDIIIAPQRRGSHHNSQSRVQHQQQDHHQLNPKPNLIQAMMDAPKDVNSNSAPSPASSSITPNTSSACNNNNEASASGVPPQQAEPNSGPGSGPQESPQLPPLTPADFKTYNRLAVQMDYFHDHFRSMWKTLYSACTANRRPANLSLRQFLDEGLRLTKYLEGHHSIEETYLYPILARKMPQFAGHSHSSKRGGGKKGENALLKQHEEIHKGMDVFEEYLKKCKSGETELELAVLKEKMDTWGEVLFQHLDDEVRELEADVMRRYWTLAEIKAIPI